jgi:Uma2 family endonuclease
MAGKLCSLQSGQYLWDGAQPAVSGVYQLQHSTKLESGVVSPIRLFTLEPDFQLQPQDNAPVDVNVFGPPTLAIEISGSTFKDDLGAKRLLYERLGVAEYWVVNVAEQDVIAFAVADQRSGEVQTSTVLPGLEIALVEEALRRSQTEDDSSLMRWLMERVQ